MGKRKLKDFERFWKFFREWLDGISLEDSNNPLFTDEFQKLVNFANK